MKTLFRNSACLLALALVAACPSVALCDELVGLAYDNATVWQTGPRPGDNGKRFLNIEGRNNGQFASFGVVDMFVFTEGATIKSIDSVTVGLTQANAAFTTDGRIRFWVTGDVLTDIQPSDKPAIAFDASDPSGVGKQLQPLFELGPADFVQTMSGDTDYFTFKLGDKAQQLLVDYINTYSVFRLVITPDDEDVAATYAGDTHELYFEPFVILEATLK
jgi:hypothetical protein